MSRPTFWIRYSVPVTLVSITCLHVVEILIEEGLARGRGRHWPAARRPAGRRPRAQSLSTPSIVARSASTASTLAPSLRRSAARLLDLRLVGGDDQVEAVLCAQHLRQLAADAGRGAGDDGELIGRHERILS